MLERVLNFFGFHKVQCGFTAGAYWIVIDGHLICDASGKVVQTSNDRNVAVVPNDRIRAIQLAVFGKDLGYGKYQEFTTTGGH